MAEKIVVVEDNNYGETKQESYIVNKDILAKEMSKVHSWIEDVKYVWRRKNVGTYPKWILSPVKKFLRFCFKHFTHYKIEFVLRGRGKRLLGCRQDLPLKYAKRAALYVSIYRR